MEFPEAIASVCERLVSAESGSVCDRLVSDESKS